MPVRTTAWLRRSATPEAFIDASGRTVKGDPGPHRPRMGQSVYKHFPLDRGTGRRSVPIVLHA
jgi:hypothetical protein